MTTKKKRLLEFRIDEISAVDFPGQEPALALIMKGQNVRKATGSAVAATTTKQGHAHPIFISESYAPHRTATVKLGYGRSVDSGEHTHSIVNAGGVWSVVENMGHTHAINAKAQKAINDAIAALNLPEGQPVIAKSEDEVMTSRNAVAVANKAAILAAKSEYQHLSKSQTTREETLRVALSISDPEARETLLTALRADGEAPENLDASESAEVVLDRRARDRSRTTGMTYEKAYNEVLRSEDGIQLAEAAQFERLPLHTQQLYCDAFAGIVRDGELQAAARDSNASLRALDSMARALQKRGRGMTFEAAYDAVLATPDGKRLYQMHADAIRKRRELSNA